MKKSLLALHVLLLVSHCSFSQGVGIGTATPDASAALDITHTAKGLLIPRMGTVAVNAIISPARGLLVYDSLANQLMVNTGTPGVPQWQPITSNGSGWSLTGNSNLNPNNQFIGTTDNQPLRFRINNTTAGELQPVTGNISWGLRAGVANTTGFSNIAVGTDALKLNSVSANLVAIGDSALLNNNDGTFNTAIGSKSLLASTSGSSNTATGYESLRFNSTGSENTATGSQSLFSNITGNSNTANGFQSLFSNTTGGNNTATGFNSLFSNTTGNSNTATGLQSLRANITGSRNTATGFNSLSSNTTGDNNTAAGFQSLSSNTTGIGNTASGNQSLFSNTTGINNIATGNGSLFLNTAGNENTATGSQSLGSNTTGPDNTATGFQSLHSNATGGFNTAIGMQSHFLNRTGNSNTAVGAFALGTTTQASDNTVVGFNAGFIFNLGSGNTIIGSDADAWGEGATNCVAIGAGARCLADNQVRFGTTATTSIGGAVGFSIISDGRFKKNIQEKVKGIDFIMKLRPVTYQLDIAGLNGKLNPGGKTDHLSKKGLDENGRTVFSGFVAQEVEQAAKATGYDFSGVDKPKNENDIYGLRYSDFVVPLVKAIQEQQQMIDELKKQNEELKKNNAGQKTLSENLLKRLEQIESSLNIKK